MEQRSHSFYYFTRKNLGIPIVGGVEYLIWRHHIPWSMESNYKVSVFVGAPDPPTSWHDARSPIVISLKQGWTYSDANAGGRYHTCVDQGLRSLMSGYLVLGSLGTTSCGWANLDMNAISILSYHTLLLKEGAACEWQSCIY